MSQYKFNLALLFKSISKEKATKTAFQFLNGTRATFEEVDMISNDVIHYLINKEISKGDVVAIFNNKSLEAYAIMLACLKIGATYTNLDANSPVERLKRMINTCQPALFFVPENKRSILEKINITKDNISCYDTEEFPTTFMKTSGIKDHISEEIDGNTPAYIMFTSGSTGFPKGVVISHANVLNFIQWAKHTYNIGEDDRFTNINPMHFDNSVFDFYASVFNGACMIPVPESETKNPRKFIRRLNELNPTIWFSVPSMMVYVLKLRALGHEDLPTLRIVTFGGEGFPKAQLRRLWQIWGHRVKFINVYGPTECTCICSSYKVTEEDMTNDELLPLGPIAPNFNFVIVDDNGKSVPDGETGELCITGPNVGLGYFNNPEATQKAFKQHPLHASYPETVYKSGDLVRFDAEEKVLHFCGRRDNQIKRMGYRIELEEIENAIASLNYVEENAVVFIKNNDSGKIIAHLRSGEKEKNTILNDLKDKIPSYMMPDELVFHEHLPKNHNGKIDRLQLKRYTQN